MRVLFLTLLDFKSYTQHNIYCDLLREFIKNGHEVFCISPSERRTGMKTHFEENQHLLKLKIGNVQKTNIVEKGISTLWIEHQFVTAIKKYFYNVKFDLVLYSTPPITLQKVVAFVKERDNARTYLLLKDIFPQNSLDIGMLSSSGLKGILYRFFRNKEKQLYAISDRIGCMSQANVDYVLKHNPEIPNEKVEICPNCIEPCDMSINAVEQGKVRIKYGIPPDKKVFVYGGNLGKPQDISFVIECLKTQESNTEAFFLIVGDGTEFGKLKAYFDADDPCNMKLMKCLPKEDYDRMVAACDVGLIFLDHRFTIPNFPSRLLAYMQSKLPVLACTDVNTDLGQVIVNGGFGWWCESRDVSYFQHEISLAVSSDTQSIGKMGHQYLMKHYTASHCYDIIINGLGEEIR